MARATLVLALVLGVCVVAGSARAQTPSAACSTFPTNGIRLVGRNFANTPPEDVVGEFSVTVMGGSPCVVIPGATVTIDFSGCAPDIILSRIQTFTGVSVFCNGPSGLITASTNGLGVATFRILGGAINNLGNMAGNPNVCAEIRCNAVFFADVEVAAFDQTANLNGVNPGDLAVVISDINHSNLARRSDFNLNGAVNPADLSAMVTVLLSGTSAQNTSAVCP